MIEEILNDKNRLNDEAKVLEKEFEDSKQKFRYYQNSMLEADYEWTTKLFEFETSKKVDIGHAKLAIKCDKKSQEILVFPYVYSGSSHLDRYPLRIYKYTGLDSLKIIIAKLSNGRNNFKIIDKLANDISEYMIK